MLTKNDIINELLSLNCSIDRSKLNKMKKHELELLLKNYSLTPEIQSRRPNEVNYDFSSSESESEVELNVNRAEESEDESDALVRSVIRSKQYDREQESEQTYYEPKAKAKPKVNIRSDIKNACAKFKNNVDSLLSEFRNDKDTDYLVDQYNIMYNDIEHELNMYLSSNNGSDADYNFADSLLQVQNNRIKRIVK